MAGIVDKFGQYGFRLADHDRLAVPADLIGAEGGVETAHHHRNSPAAVFGCDLVGALRCIGLDADGNEIGRLVERYGLEPIVVEPALDVGGEECGEHGRGQGLHPPAADVALYADMPADAGVHDRDPERARHHAGPRFGIDAAAS